MRTKKRNKEQQRKTEENRIAVLNFMQQFNAREFWTINGPMDTDVDEIMCFAWFKPNGDVAGISLVQTWCRGGWDIYVTPGPYGDLARTALCMLRSLEPINVAAPVAAKLTDDAGALLSEILERCAQMSVSDLIKQDWFAAWVKRADEAMKKKPLPLDVVVATLETEPDYKALYAKAVDLLHDNFAAWDDEEDSVKEEHAELIDKTQAFLESEDVQSDTRQRAAAELDLPKFLA